MTDPAVTTAKPDAALLAADVLEEEARRQSEPEPTIPDLSEELLRDVGDGPKFVGLTRVATAVVALAAATHAALLVAGPTLAEANGFSPATLRNVAVFGAAGSALWGLAIGTINDRWLRPRLVALAAIAVGVGAALAAAITGPEVAVLAGLVGWANLGVLISGIALAADNSVGGRRATRLGRVIAAGCAGSVVGAVGVGFAVDTDSDASRFVFVALAVVSLGAAVIALRSDEIPRGRLDRSVTLGDRGRASPAPSVMASVARLRSIDSLGLISFVTAAVGAMTSVLVVFGLRALDDRLGLGPIDRAAWVSAIAVGLGVGAVAGGGRIDRLVAADRRTVVRPLAGLVVAGGLAAASLFASDLWIVVAIVCGGSIAIGVVLGGVLAMASLVAPLSLRGQAMGLVGAHLFLGGLGGSLIAGLIASGSGERSGAVWVAGGAALVGGVRLSLGGRLLGPDVSAVVSTLKAEHAEAQTLAAGDDLPVIQVRNIDFSYGQLQVLFDVTIDVQRGEALALLGTNGAGKSTLLKVVTGLGSPSRGSVLLRGRDITFAEAEHRVGMGIVQVPGGKAVFPTLSVRENLIVGSYTFVRDKQRVEERIEAVLTLFPKLRERIDQAAGTMSGGEQQMLAIAKGLLLEPKILCIDELSLGLAPVVVQEILEVVEELRTQGITLVIVEQSVNVALSICDRAIFMEKGRIRFQGPSAELLERGDLVRAVFLGGEGG